MAIGIYHLRMHIALNYEHMNLSKKKALELEIIDARFERYYHSKEHHSMPRYYAIQRELAKGYESA